MRFEIGKTYKFDKEKFMEINGVEQHKNIKNFGLMILKVLNLLLKKLLMMAMFAIQMNFGVISEWCVEVK
ncbi:hypothetical protein ERM65_10525 [Clostridioides difficile]|nr:hypothetical protein [Clostridioides difficile]EGT4224060.1 hypothetical protein [Clostridioides difficile]